MQSERSAFPFTPSPDRTDGDARLVDLFTEEAERLLDALKSETARSILAALGEEPATTSDLADRSDTSLQNVHYHLERLEEAGLVRVVGTHYSARGKEMDVYAPAHEPLVLVGGDDDARRAVADHTREATGETTDPREVTDSREPAEIPGPGA